MLFTVLSFAALVVTVVLWVICARRGLAALTSLVPRVAALGFAATAVAAVLTGTWAALAVSVVSVAVFALLGVVSRQLSVDRYPTDAARAALRELGGEVAAGGEGSPIVGEIWQLPAGLFLVASTRDDESELGMWVRAAAVALRSAPDGTRLLMVTDGAETRTVTVAGTEVSVAATSELRAVVGGPNRAKRRRRR